MFLKAIVAAVLVLVFGPILQTMWYMGWHLHSLKHHPGKCRVVKQAGKGSEDFETLSSGLTFITSGAMDSTMTEEYSAYVRSHGRGSIQVMDLNLPNAEAKPVVIKHDENFNSDTFRPHGLSVLEDKVKGEHIVYVINHADGQKDSVEKFRYSPKNNQLHHVKSIFSDAFHITNDLALVSEDRFYITRYSYFHNYLGVLFETLYSLSLGGILYHNGTHTMEVQSGMLSPNGVTVSRDKRYLYLSSTHSEQVQVYEIERSSHGLQLVQGVNVHTGVADNFHWSEDGHSLYIGCHPIMHKVVSHVTNPAQSGAPSQVIRLPLKNSLIVEEEITEEFYDQGDLISASSIAGVYKNKLLIGSVIDTLVVCDLPKEVGT